MLDLFKFHQVGIVRDPVGAFLHFDHEDIFVITSRIVNNYVGKNPNGRQCAVRIGQVYFFGLHAVAIVLGVNLESNQ